MSQREEGKSLQLRGSEKAKLIETRKKETGSNEEKERGKRRIMREKDERSLLIVEKIVSQCVE